MSGSSLTFGTQWLGQLPDDWSQMRARYLFRERKQKSSPDDTHLTPSQKYAVLPQSEYMKLTGNRVVLNLTGSDNMKHVESGDFVIHLRSFQGGIEYSKYTGKVSNAYTVLQPKETVVPDFFRHVLKSYGFISELSKTTDQLRDGQSIKFSQLDLLEFPLPSPEIQQKIADFLDTETAQIDNLIAKQERLLELLEEKRRAAITHAVTRGLDSGVELKETNINWFARIPYNWRATSLRRACTLITDGSHFSPKGQDEGMPYVTVKDLSDGKINSEDAVKISLDDYKSLEKSGCRPKKGDVLFSKDGTVGKVAIVKNDEFVVLSSLAILRSGHELLPDYLFYFLQSESGVRQVESFYAGAALKRITLDTLVNIRLTLPSVDEQKTIVEYLERHDEKSNVLKQKIQTQISLLRERRTSLISHVVTGKVRV